MSTKHLGTPTLQQVQHRFQRAEPRAGIAMLVFWKNLFELNPSLRPLLPEQGTEQDRMMTRLLGAEATTLGGLRSPAPANPPSSAASESTGAGAPSVVGEALLWTLQEAYGADFTPQARTAWEALYRFVTGTTKAESPAAAKGTKSGATPLLATA